MVRAIVGANWGDEGKGKITDMLAEGMPTLSYPDSRADANAGHTIVNNYGRFRPSHCCRQASFTDHTTSIIGNGVALNIPFLVKELESLVSQGVPMPHILVSDRAQILMPYHVLFDTYEEERLGRQVLRFYQVRYRAVLL